MNALETEGYRLTILSLTGLPVSMHCLSLFSAIFPSHLLFKMTINRRIEESPHQPGPIMKFQVQSETY